jgi:hypothetical protein
MVEAEDATVLFLPDGIVHHAHNVGMNLRCLRENIVDSVCIEVLGAARKLFWWR